MRGTTPKQPSMLALVSMESLVPPTHPLPAVKRLVDEVLRDLDPVFAGMYAAGGRPSVATAPALASIPRVRGSWLFGPAPVWTDGTVNPAFRPLSEALESKGLLSVRVSTEMTEDSGNCKVRPALRYSNDGLGWDASKELVAG